MRIGRPAASRPVAICSRQPGLPDTITSASVLRMFCTLRSRRSGSGVGLEQVVDAGRSAADFRLGDLADGDAGNGLQEAARLRAHALRMLQMAGVVIRRFELNGSSRRARLELCEHFGNVLALRGERLRLRGVCRIVAQQMAVSLHRGAAARCVDDDGVGVGVFERVDQFPGRRHGIFFFAGMLGERTAAPLRLRNDDFAAFGGEDARGRLVDTSEEHTLDASERAVRPAYAAALAQECAPAERPVRM